MKDNFEMSMMGEMKFFLGLQIHRSSRGIFISQSQYTMEILKKHSMDGCDSISTPMATARIDADLQDRELSDEGLIWSLRPFTSFIKLRRSCSVDESDFLSGLESRTAGDFGRSLFLNSLD
ncbi:retrovirus-related pol polyprotein from transposon TNT 1-94 [Tanacetum coccineum]